MKCYICKEDKAKIFHNHKPICKDCFEKEKPKKIEDGSLEDCIYFKRECYFCHKRLIPYDCHNVADGGQICSDYCYSCRKLFAFKTLFDKELGKISLQAKICKNDLPDEEIKKLMKRSPWKFKEFEGLK